MDALGSSWWSSHPFRHFHERGIKRRKNDRNSNRKPSSSSSSSSSSNSSIQSNAGFHFPLKQAVTAGSLALTGDTIAQLRNRWSSLSSNSSHDSDDKEFIQNLFSSHDWIRALRMASYGFLFYGPGSFVWYQTLDRFFPQPTVKNIMTKVLLNQIILGPAVIAVVFAWNNLWQGKVSELPKKYQKDAFPTLLVGFRFWVPYSVLNFWAVPLQARVAFMSFGSIFWNFILSSTVSK